MTLHTDHDKVSIKEPEKEGPDAEMRKTVCISPETTRAFDDFINMLRYKRPGGSKTERHFIKEYIRTLDVKDDKYGNLYKRVGNSPVLWSCHTDTVHERKGMQIIGYDKMDIGVASTDKSGSACLGADDTTGLWLMREMILAKVPGLYVFHRDEETGRKGSKFIAENNKKLLDGIKFAIALDRRGTTDVITHQLSSRCCSDDFAKDLAAIINRAGLNYKPDPTGSYTDTASYTDLVAECTNLSVGYKGAHTTFERQDVGHLFKMRDALIGADLSSLVPTRKPGEKEYRSYSYNGGSYRNNRAAHGYSDGMYGSVDGFYDEWGYVWNAATKEYEYDPDKSLANGTKHNTTGPGSTVRHLSGVRGSTGTKSGTQVGNGVNGGGANGHNVNHANAHHYNGNTAVIMLPPPAIKEADDDDGDDEADYESGHSSSQEFDLIVKLVKRNPDAIADILEQFGMGLRELQEEIMNLYGVVNC